MSSSVAELNRGSRTPESWGAPRGVVVTRALIAFVYAAGLVAAIGDRVPRTHSDVPVLAAVLLMTYPLIDVIASLVAVSRGRGQSIAVLRINAVVGILAVVAIAVTAFGSDAGAALIAFGVWAAISGALLLGTAIRDRRTQGGQVFLLVSGTLSTVAGIMFVVSSRMDRAHLATIGGYMALGGVLYLLSARRRSTSSQPRAEAAGG
jgi:uncharacterized membrane protein HdeD (DUF308 family)